MLHAGVVVSCLLLEESKSAALRNFLDNAFRLNVKNGMMLNGMSAQQAMQWLQMQPKAFGST